MPLRRKEKPLERGGRVYLRRPTAGDTKEVLATVRTSRRLHRPWVYPTETKSAFDDYIWRNQEPDFVGLLICRLSDDRILGMANLSQIFRGNLQAAYLGFWASAEFAGQGYMNEGLKLVLRYAFKKLKLHRLEANVQPANEPSKGAHQTVRVSVRRIFACYLKVGGVWRDHERWAIHADEWAEGVKGERPEK